MFKRYYSVQHHLLTHVLYLLYLLYPNPNPKPTHIRQGGKLTVLTSSHSTVGMGRITLPRENLSIYGSAEELVLYGDGTELHVPGGMLDQTLPSGIQQAASGVDGLVSSFVNLTTGKTTPHKGGVTGMTRNNLSATNLMAKSASSSSISSINSSGQVIGGGVGGAVTSPRGSPTKSCKRDTLDERAQLVSLYGEIAADCAQCNLCVSVVMCCGNQVDDPTYVDTALLSEPSMRTGGKVSAVKLPLILSLLPFCLYFVFSSSVCSFILLYNLYSHSLPFPSPPLSYTSYTPLLLPIHHILLSSYLYIIYSSPLTCAPALLRHWLYDERRECLSSRAAAPFLPG